MTFRRRAHPAECTSRRRAIRLSTPWFLPDRQGHVVTAITEGIGIWRARLSCARPSEFNATEQCPRRLSSSRRRRTHSLTHHARSLMQHYIIYYVPSDFQGRTIDPSPCSAADPRVTTFVRRLIAITRRSLMGSRSIRPRRTRNTTVETAN